MAAQKLITSSSKFRHLRLIEQWCHTLPLSTLLVLANVPLKMAALKLITSRQHVGQCEFSCPCLSHGHP
eukprot:10427648-Karenia_brevis.AAC.1